MSSAKEQAIRIVQSKSDESSVDEIVHELIFHRMIEHGLDDADTGRTITHEELGQRSRQWQS